MATKNEAFLDKICQEIQLEIGEVPKTWNTLVSVEMFSNQTDIGGSFMPKLGITMTFGKTESILCNNNFLKYNKLLLLLLLLSSSSLL